MLDKPFNNDIINPSTRGTDFLYQNRPVVGAVGLNRSSGRHRKGAFLLGERMSILSKCVICGKKVIRYPSDIKTGKNICYLNKG